MSCASSAIRGWVGIEVNCLLGGVREGIEEVGRRAARAERGRSKDGAQVGDVVRRTVDRGLREGSFHSRDGLMARRAGRDELARERIVVRCDRRAGLDLQGCS